MTISYITKYRLIPGVSSLTCRAHAWNRKFHFHQLGLNHFELLKADYFVVIVTVMSLTSTLHACMPQSSSSSLWRYDAEDYNGATWNGRYVSNTDMLLRSISESSFCLFVCFKSMGNLDREVCNTCAWHACHARPLTQRMRQCWSVCSTTVIGIRCLKLYVASFSYTAKILESWSIYYMYDAIIMCNDGAVPHWYSS